MERVCLSTTLNLRSIPPLLNAALALIGFDPELAALAQLQEQTVPRTFGVTSRRNNNDVCL